MVKFSHKGPKYKLAFDLETGNFKGQCQKQWLQWKVLIKVNNQNMHVQFERIIISSFPTIDLKAVA